MSYLRYICVLVLAQWHLTHIVVLFCFPSSCVLYFASFSFNGFNRGGVLKEIGTTYPSRAPVLVLGFVGGTRDAHLF
jgi:hypothetical protein